MKNWALLAVAFLALALAGCVSHAKPVPQTPPVPASAGNVAAPVPRPEPLSTPQTRVALPPEQPLNPESLVVEAPPPAPPPAAAPTPAPTARRSPPAATQAKPDTSAPAATEPASPPPRPAIQEALPDTERNQFLQAAKAKRGVVRAWLDSAAAQHLNAQGRRTRSTIEGFLSRSEEAEKRNDAAAAAQLADRAVLLMQELQNGR